MKIGSFTKYLLEALNMHKFHNIDYLRRFGVGKIKYEIKVHEEEMQFASIIESINNLGT